MQTYKLKAGQKLKLIASGYSLKEIEAHIKTDIPKGKTLKICFSDEEILDWIKNRYPIKKSITELLEWWKTYAKSDKEINRYLGNIKHKKLRASGLYKLYEECREQGKPLVLYKEMAVDNKPHKVY
jgi:hypothetical protein